MRITLFVALLAIAISAWGLVTMNTGALSGHQPIHVASDNPPGGNSPVRP